MKKKLFALRHGERADRAPTNRSCPLIFDPCLTEKGLIQAEQSAQKIFSELQENCKIHLVSSPFLRCIETASKISSILNVPIFIEEGFGEFLFPWDFPFDPMELLHVRVKGTRELGKEIGEELIENQHLTRAKHPETVEEGKERIRFNWGKYLEMRDEDVIILVSHLYVVGTVSEVWLGENYQISEDGYCKLTTAESDGT